MERTRRWLAVSVDRPAVAVLILLALSGLATIGYLNPALLRARAPESRGPRAVPRAATSAETRPSGNARAFSLTDADSILVVESPEIFTPVGARALRAVVAHLESLPHVDSILWIDRVPIMNIFGLQEPLFPHDSASPARFAAARAKALDHPLIAGQLLSRDGETLLLLVRMDWLYVESDEDCMEGLRDAAATAAARHDVPLEFSVTGRVPLFVTAIDAQQQNRFRFQLIGYGMIALTSVILFRGLTAVLIVALAPALGVFWTIGVLQFFDLADNPFNDVVLPVLLSLVGLTDGVHLMVQIRRHRSAGRLPSEASRLGVQEVGLACAMTSLTTAIGFGSLSLAHHQIVREFGGCCVLGVLLTFVAVVTAIPLASASRLGKRVQVGHSRGLIDRHLSRIGLIVDYVIPRSRRFGVLGIVATASLFAVSLQLQPDERNANSLPTRSQAAIALAKMDRAMGGLETAEVAVEWSAGVASQSGQLLHVLGEVDQLLTREALIGSPLSIYQLVAALPGDSPVTSRMAMLDLLPPPLKRAFYTPEEQSAKVVFRVQDLGIARYGPVFTRVEAGLREIQLRHPGFQLDLRGRAAWRWRNLYQIVVDLAASLGSATVIIFAVLAVVYRSMRIGLISIVPNVFPLALTGAYLYWSGEALELVTVCAFTVCLGIAVDDTIHFLTRYREEQRRTASNREALRRAFTSVGTALVMTTVVLVCGFATVIFSGSRDHRIFAAMGGLTISAALAGDLLFLPALLAWFDSRSEGPRDDGPAESLAEDLPERAPPPSGSD